MGNGDRGRMKKEEKESELKRILPIIWNSYQHMYDVRSSNIQNRANFLLIIISFLPILSFIMFSYFKSEIFLLPILFQFLAFIVLIKSFFIRNWPLVNWLELKETLKSIEKNEFDKNLFSSLKSLENTTWLYYNEMNKIVKISIYLLLLSFYGMILALFSFYFNFNFYLYTLIFILGLLPVLIFFFYYAQPKLIKLYNARFKEFIEDVEKWFEGELK